MLLLESINTNIELRASQDIMHHDVSLTKSFQEKSHPFKTKSFAQAVYSVESSSMTLGSSLAFIQIKQQRVSN
jgi:hypothetical protein